ncbi:MAG: holin [Clostridia bacterium]|nr:holin [Clostridia bacterium]
MNEAIIALCLAVGLLYKHCTPLDNRYIPLLVAVVGIGAAVVTHWAGGITMLVIVEGIWSGLASTGLHQMFTKLFIKAE